MITNVVHQFMSSIQDLATPAADEKDTPEEMAMEFSSTVMAEAGHAVEDLEHKAAG